MDQFIQYTPTEILFGENTQAEVGKEVKKWGGSRVRKRDRKPGRR